MIVFKTSATQPFVTRSNDTLFSTHAAAYQWYYNGSPIPLATDSFLVITGDGTYAVMITDEDGCSRVSDGLAVLVKAIDGMGGWKVWPNPAEDQLTINNEQLIIGNTIALKIYNVLGEMVLQSEIRTSTSSVTGRKTEIDVHGLPKGMYVVEVGDGVRIYRSKFVKE